MLLSATGLRRTYAGQAVLDGIDLQVSSGGSLAITGASGSGKSSLLHILAGMAAPEAGRVWWDDLDPYGLTAGRRRRLQRARIGWMAQAPLLDPDQSARANCLLPAAFRRLPKADAQADALLEGVGLSGQEQIPAAALSGGQAVRCALARTLLPEPDLLLADEPTGSLDAATAATVAGVLLALCHQSGCTLVLATHDEALARRCQATIHLQGDADRASAPTPVA